MSKKCYRFFGGLLNAQANWLNQILHLELIQKAAIRRIA